MRTGEVEKWAQKDDPVEATAIFPPDEPQSWPATELPARDRDQSSIAKRPRCQRRSPGRWHLDQRIQRQQRCRAHAQRGQPRRGPSKKARKSAEVAEHLSTKSTIQHRRNRAARNPRARTQGQDRLGHGSQRAGPKPHDLPLRRRRPLKRRPLPPADEGDPGSQAPGGEEADIREPVTSYSGQEELGWKLRKPTAVTTEPNGLDLKHETLYEEATGNVIETKTPGGTAKAEPPIYAAPWGPTVRATVSSTTRRGLRSPPTATSGSRTPTTTACRSSPPQAPTSPSSAPWYWRRRVLRTEVGRGQLQRAGLGLRRGQRHAPGVQGKRRIRDEGRARRDRATASSNVHSGSPSTPTTTSGSPTSNTAGS